MNTSTSTSPGVMAPSNGADSSSNQSTDDSTTDEFEAILNQLSALGSEIDQELSHSKRNTEQVAFAPKPTEVPTVKPIANSAEQQFNTGTMRLKTNTSGSIGSQDSSQFYNSHVHHFSHLYHSQATENGSSSTRTDSPDNDSAFSDSISLLSSEQSSSSSCSSSSSSSSSAANRQPSNSTLCSTTTSSLTVQSAASNQQPINTNVAPTSTAKPTFISTSSSQQLNTNLTSNLNSSPSLPPTSPLSTSSHSSENSTLTPNNNNNSFFSGLSLDRQLSQLNHQQELFFEQLGINATPQAVKPSTTSASQLQKDSNSFDANNQDSQELLSISEQFKYIFNVVNIEPKRSSVIGPTGDDDNNDSSDSDDDNQSEDSELVGRSDMTLADCDNINNNGGGTSINNVTDNNIDDDNDDNNEIERNIQLAMDKIREASYRKLYLKVFAQDNSAKSLLADERMTIGAICGQLAVKNHVEMHTSLAIIEHMPHLYMERFYEDHESLVENVLLWGRESANKLYFMQRTEKYDLFVQPEKYLENSSDGTLKSRDTNSGLAMLRNELIGQCFESDVVRVPQIESDLYLRVEGKKSWKKYFFSLRPSGVYYCVKGKPKSTADLLCLTTFEMNCVYYGFGWKKKFKAPYDYGFAIKHPQQQTKSHKQIKYLCAHSEDQLRLWMTGIRIAKYGRTLLDNYTQFGQSGAKIQTGEHAKPMYNSLPEPDSHHLPTEPNSNSQSVTMRPNRITRDESSRSSSTSSSSGCMSEGGQSSVVSTPSTGSGHSSVSNPTNRYMPQQLSNGTLSPPPFSPHHHHQLDTHPSVTSLQYLSSPNHHSHQYPTQHSIQQSSVSLNAFEADFPTIKRKPSMPKIPLTNTTRNLALQSDDALLEVNENGSAVDANGFTEEELYGTGMSASPSHGDFSRGTFKTGTLRRSTTDERMKGKMSISSPMHHINYLQPPPPSSVATKSDSEDELPPPPPPPCGLKESESVQSLNSSFPPPPPEMMSSPTPPPLNSMSQQPPQPLPHLHNVSMTPQPQPKNPSNSNRLSRRLSDLSPNSATYLSYRHAPLNDFPGCSTMPHMMPNTRASIATSSGLLGQNEPVLGNSSNSTSNLYSPQTGFATLKPYHSRAASGSGLMTNGSSVNGRFQRQLTLDLHSINKYGTAPRIRNEPFMAQLAHQQQLQQQQQHHLQNHCTNEFGAPAAVPNTYESFRASTNNYGGGPSCIAAGMQPSTAHFMDNNKQSTSPHYHTTGAILNGSHSASSVHNVYGSAAAAATGSGATLGGEKINEMPQLMTQQQQQPIMSPPVPPHQHHHHHQHMAEPQGIPPPSHYGIPPSKTSSQYPPPPSPHQPQTVSSVAGMHAHLISPQIDCCNQAILLDRTGYHNNNNSSSGNMIAPSGISNSSGVSRSAPLSTPPPPPQPQPQLASLPPQATVPQHSPGVIQTGAITTIPSNKENIIYMSISPHLLQKHQQMQRHQRQPQHHHQNGSDIYGAQMYGSQQAAQHQIYQVPPEQIFLKNMERVMQKKWHVAQMLTQENHAGATPGQVLGFRDSAYLPPRDDGTQGINQQQTQFANYAPQPQSPHMHNIPHYHINQVPQSPTYNGTVQYDSQAMYGAQQAKGKSVRILDSPTIIGHAPESPNHYSPSQQQIYGMGVNGAKRVPPPPPRRSENTHLTTNNNSNTSSSRR